jgi:hypothetical protein
MIMSEADSPAAGFRPFFNPAIGEWITPPSPMTRSSRRSSSNPAADGSPASTFSHRRYASPRKQAMNFLNCSS